MKKGVESTDLIEVDERSASAFSRQGKRRIEIVARGPMAFE